MRVFVCLFVCVRARVHVCMWVYLYMRDGVYNFSVKNDYSYIQYMYICIIESVHSISRDEQDAPLTQYITNAGITRARYTITHF